MQWEQRVFSFSLLLFSSLYSNLYQFFSHFWTPLKTSLFFYFFIFALFFPFPEKKNGKPHSHRCPKNPLSRFFFSKKNLSPARFFFLFYFCFPPNLPPPTLCFSCLAPKILVLTLRKPIFLYLPSSSVPNSLLSSRFSSSLSYPTFPSSSRTNFLLKSSPVNHPLSLSLALFFSLRSWPLSCSPPKSSFFSSQKKWRPPTSLHLPSVYPLLQVFPYSNDQPVSILKHHHGKVVVSMATRPSMLGSSRNQPPTLPKMLPVLPGLWHLEKKTTWKRSPKRGSTN